MGDDFMGEAEDDVGIVQLVLVAQIVAARLSLQSLQFLPVRGGSVAAQDIHGKDLAVPGVTIGDVRAVHLLRV